MRIKLFSIKEKQRETEQKKNPKQPELHSKALPQEGKSWGCCSVEEHVLSMTQILTST